jgi:hypothetical protein
MRFVVLPWLVLVASCVTTPNPPATYAPLVCDPGAADHVAFVVQETSAFFGAYPTKVYGATFLVVDGSCRFFVATRADAFVGVVRTGVLTVDELDAINAELLGGAWLRIDGEHRFDTMGADGQTLALWRDDLGASCYWSCGAGSTELQSMVASAWSWADRLAARAEPSSGPVRVFVEESFPATDDVPVWTGPPFVERSVLVSDPTYVATLRTLRVDPTASARGGITLRVGDRNVWVTIVDDMPHTNAEHRLLPPFPIHT